MNILDYNFLVGLAIFHQGLSSTNVAGMIIGFCVLTYALITKGTSNG